LKHLLYILAFLSLNYSALAADDKNNGKEGTRTVLIKVSDNTGEELAGAKLVVTETGKEFIADFNGNIQLTFRSNETITVKILSLGYSEKTIRSNELSTFNDLSLSPL
jgi:hypothetical protein